MKHFVQACMVMGATVFYLLMLQKNINLKEINLKKKIYSSFLCYYHVTYEFQGKSTLYSFPECQGSPYSKQASYLKFKWQQQDLNLQPLVFKGTLNHLAKSVCLTKFLSACLWKSGCGFESHCCHFYFSCLGNISGDFPVNIMK